MGKIDWVGRKEWLWRVGVVVVEGGGERVGSGEVEIGGEMKEEEKEVK